MNAITITIPLPPRETMVNARHAHWGKRARHTRKQRGDAALAALCAMNAAGIKPPQWDAAVIHTTFYFRDHRHQDPDSLLGWLKASRDALQDVGIIRNDKRLIPMPPVVRIDKLDPRVELEIVKA